MSPNLHDVLHEPSSSPIRATATGFGPPRSILRHHMLISAHHDAAVVCRRTTADATAGVPTNKNTLLFTSRIYHFVAKILYLDPLFIYFRYLDAISCVFDRVIEVLSRLTDGRVRSVSAWRVVKEIRE